MKKLSLLVGTLGGAFAGYLFSNKKLREKLSRAKDPEEAAKLLGSCLQKDGKQLAKQVREFVESDEVQKNVAKAKQFAAKKMDEAKKELNSLIKKNLPMGKKRATGKRGAKKKIGTTGAARKPARMRTKTRTLS